MDSNRYCQIKLSFRRDGKQPEHRLVMGTSDQIRKHVDLCLESALDYAEITEIQIRPSSPFGTYEVADDGYLSLVR